MDTQITFKTKNGDIDLVRQDLVAGKVSMKFPATFQELPEENKKEAYGQKIEVSKSNKEKTAVFSMIIRTLGDKAAETPEEEQVEEAVTGFRQVFSRVAPGYQEIGVFTKVVDGNPIGCINFFSHGIKSEMFQIFALFKIDHDLYQCNFTCRDSDAEEWNLIFLACIDSIRIV